MGLTAFLAEHWGDLASILGLMVGVIGFSYTVGQVRQAKTAAEQTREAVGRLRALIRHVDSVAELAAALVELDGIYSHVHAGRWKEVRSQCGPLRQKLHVIKTETPDLTEEDELAFQRVIRLFRNLEQAISEAGDSVPSRDALRGLVSEDIDGLHAILARLKKKTGDHDA